MYNNENENTNGFSNDSDNSESTSPSEKVYPENNSPEQYSSDATPENTVLHEEAATPVENITDGEKFAGGESYIKTESTVQSTLPLNSVPVQNASVTNGYAWNGQNSGKSAKKAKKKVSGLRVFTTAILTVFVLSFVAMSAVVITYVVNDRGIEKTAAPSGSTASQENSKANASSSDYAAILPDTDSGAATLTIPQIAAKCSPSAVGIKVEVDASYNYGFGFYSQSQTAQAVGSGFILNTDGYIITNHHVIEDAKKITVILSDKTEVDAELVGSDELSDVAVIKITPPDGVTLVPMEVGNSDDLVVGEAVVAIGCPAGIEYMGTVTNGIVSAINRDVEITDSYGRVQKTMTLIQTNATINKGNSGGPLINSKGQVIGINTLKLTSEFEGIGFSIPINGAMSIINQLIDYGKVVERTEEDFAYGSGVIGISGSAVSADEAEYYGIPEGVLVVQIDKASSAAIAGLRRGDIITKYNGTEVKTVDDINNLKAKNRAGEEVTITVYRDAQDGTKESTFDIVFKLDAQK